MYISLMLLKAEIVWIAILSIERTISSVLVRREVSEMKIILVRLVTFIVCIAATIVGSIFLGTVLDVTGFESLHHLVGTIGTSLILISIIYYTLENHVLWAWSENLGYASIIFIEYCRTGIC